jgi:hypothetical protein
VAKTKKRNFKEEGQVGKHVFFSVVGYTVVCSKGVLEEYKLSDYYDILYTENFGLLGMKLRKDKLQNIKSDMLRQRNISALKI